MTETDLPSLLLDPVTNLPKLNFLGQGFQKWEHYRQADCNRIIIIIRFVKRQNVRRLPWR